MIRRITAGLLACLMLLVSACAENTSVELRTELDQEQTEKLLTDFLPETGRDGIDIPSLLELINGFSVRTTYWEKQGIRTSIFYQDQEMIYAQYEEKADGIQLTSNLFPGIALLADRPEAVQPLAELVDQTEAWNALSEVWEAWLAGRESESRAGCFSSPVYQDAYYCDSWYFTDSDVALLIDSFLLALETEDAFEKLWSLAGAEMNSAISLLRSINHRAATENRFSYEMHVMYDEAEENIGITLNVLRNGFRDWSASVVDSPAESGEGRQLLGVVTIPRENGCWYADLSLALRDGTSPLHGSLNLYAASAGETYAAAVRDQKTKTMTSDFLLQENSGSYSFRIDSGTELDGRRLELTELIQADPAQEEYPWRHQIWAQGSEKPFYVFSTKTVPAEAFQGETADQILTENELETEEGADLLNSELLRGAQRIVVRFLSIMPVNLFNQLIRNSQ